MLIPITRTGKGHRPFKKKSVQKFVKRFLYQCKTEQGQAGYNQHCRRYCRHNYIKLHVFRLSFYIWKKTLSFLHILCYTVLVKFQPGCFGVPHLSTGFRFSRSCFRQFTEHTFVCFRCITHQKGFGFLFLYCFAILLLEIFLMGQQPVPFFRFP